MQQAGAEKVVPVPLAGCKQAAFAPRLPERRPLLVTHTRDEMPTPHGVYSLLPAPSGLESGGLNMPRNRSFPQTVLMLFCLFASEKYGADTTWVYDKMTAGGSLLADTTRTTGYYAVTAII